MVTGEGVSHTSSQAQNLTTEIDFVVNPHADSAAEPQHYDTNSDAPPIISANEVLVLDNLHTGSPSPLHNTITTTVEVQVENSHHQGSVGSPPDPNNPTQGHLQQGSIEHHIIRDVDMASSVHDAEMAEGGVEDGNEK